MVQLWISGDHEVAQNIKFAAHLILDGALPFEAVLLQKEESKNWIEILSQIDGKIIFEFSSFVDLVSYQKSIQILQLTKNFFNYEIGFKNFPLWMDQEEKSKFSLKNINQLHSLSLEKSHPVYSIIQKLRQGEVSSTLTILETEWDNLWSQGFDRWLISEFQKWGELCPDLLPSTVALKIARQLYIEAKDTDSITVLSQIRLEIREWDWYWLMGRLLIRRSNFLNAKEVFNKMQTKSDSIWNIKALKILAELEEINEWIQKEILYKAEVQLKAILKSIDNNSFNTVVEQDLRGLYFFYQGQLQHAFQRYFESLTAYQSAIDYLKLSKRFNYEALVAELNQWSSKCFLGHNVDDTSIKKSLIQSRSYFLLAGLIHFKAGFEIRNGNSKTVVNELKSLEGVLEGQRGNFHKLQLKSNLVWAKIKMGDWLSAIEDSDQAIVQAESLGYPALTIRFKFLKSRILTYLGHFEAAKKLCRTVIQSTFSEREEKQLAQNQLKVINGFEIGTVEFNCPHLFISPFDCSFLEAWDLQPQSRGELHSDWLALMNSSDAPRSKQFLYDEPWSSWRMVKDYLEKSGDKKDNFISKIAAITALKLGIVRDNTSQNVDFPSWLTEASQSWSQILSVAIEVKVDGNIIIEDGRSEVREIHADRFEKISNQFDGLVIDQIRGQIFISGKSVEALKKISILRRLIYVLCESLGNSVTKEDLMRKVWDQEYSPIQHDSLLYTTIRRIRLILEEISPKNFIEHLDRGYRLNTQAGVMVIRRGAVLKRQKVDPWTWVRQKIIMDHKLFRRELVNYFLLSEMTAKRMLSAWVLEGKLIQEGKGRGTFYRLP